MVESTLLEGLFWSAAVVVLYTYVGFPLLVLLGGIFRRSFHQDRAHTPAVSIIIAAHNEAQGIEAKLDNLLSLDYPPDRLEVIIASDGSNDGTDDLVRRYVSSRLRLLSRPRQGKAAALNAAVQESTGQILVFSDANSLYARHAVRALVAPFADPQVGGVAGNQVYQRDGGKGLSVDGEHLYWNFDRLLKTAQSRSGNVISATGAIYAIRRQLFRGVPEGVTDDFVTSTRVIAQGYRLVFAPDAVAYEPVARSSGVEFGRKVRVMTRGLRGVWQMRQLLNPGRYGLYSLQLFSHKILRRLVAVPLLILLLVNLPLWSHGPVYQLALTAQAALYGLALAGWLLRESSVGQYKLLTVPFYFCMVNLAALVAAFHFLRGRRIVVWEPQRAAAATGERRSCGEAAATGSPPESSHAALGPASRPTVS